MSESSTQGSERLNALLRKRQLRSRLFEWVCAGVTGLAVVILALLLQDVFVDGYRWVDAQFLNSFPSRFPEKAGIKSALVGTLWLVSFTALIAIQLVFLRDYLEEYAPKNRLTHFIEINIANLAGVPSIVFGILGLAIFVRFFGLGRSVIAGTDHVFAHSSCNHYRGERSYPVGSKFFAPGRLRTWCDALASRSRPCSAFSSTRHSDWDYSGAVTRHQKRLLSL